MKKLAIVGLSVLSALFIGCGKSDGPSGNDVSQQVAPQQCYTDENYRSLNAFGVCAGVATANTTPQLCYTDANYRAQNANGVCASVPNNLPQQCYTDTTYRINNINGVCAGTNNNFGTNQNTNYGNNYQSPFGNGTFGTNGGVAFGNPATQTTVFHQAPSNCGSCGANQEFVIDVYGLPGQRGRCYDRPRRQVRHSAFIGIDYDNINGNGNSQFQFAYSGSLFIPGKRNRRPVNSCQGTDARVACNLNSGNFDCARILGNNRAVCIQDGQGNYANHGFCGVIDANIGL